MRTDLNTPDGITVDEYAVFSAVCSGSSPFRFDGADLVFLDHTRSDQGRDLNVAELRTDMAGFTPAARARVIEQGDVLDDFVAKNQRRWPLKSRFQAPVAYRLVPDSEAADAQPFVSSRVGFDAAGSLALVYVENFGSTGHYMLFGRQGSTWSRLDSMMAWIA